jgi:hypothetical protein
MVTKTTHKPVSKKTHVSKREDAEYKIFDGEEYILYHRHIATNKHDAHAIAHDYKRNGVCQKYRVVEECEPWDKRVKYCNLYINCVDH